MGRHSGGQKDPRFRVLQIPQTCSARATAYWCLGWPTVENTPDGGTIAGGIAKHELTLGTSSAMTQGNVAVV